MGKYSDLNQLTIFYVRLGSLFVACLYSGFVSERSRDAAIKAGDGLNRWL